MSKQYVADFSRHEGEARKLDRLLVRILKLSVIIVVLLVCARLMTGCGTEARGEIYYDQDIGGPVVAVDLFAMADTDSEPASELGVIIHTGDLFNAHSGFMGDLTDEQAPLEIEVSGEPRPSSDVKKKRGFWATVGRVLSLRNPDNKTHMGRNWQRYVVTALGVLAKVDKNSSKIDVLFKDGDSQVPMPSLAASAPKQNTASATGGGRITIRDADRVPDHIVAAGPGSVVDIDVHMGGK